MRATHRCIAFASLTMLLPRTLRILGASLCAALTGCASFPAGYYWQSLRGHAQILQAAQPIATWIARPDTPAPLRERLLLAQRARQFAITELGLPDNASYRSYADLQRPAAVWNVVAAPPLSLTLHTWCFPVTGCIGYRGFFREADAQAQAAALARQGLEVEVYPVPAYSTLGYLNWAGGDPLLNTFIGWPEGDFVRLLFHELAHQVVYAANDTAFNESFATTVERLGVAQWLRTEAPAAAQQAYAHSEARRRDFRALTHTTRERLARIYDTAQVPEHAPEERLAMKQAVMAQFRADYAVLRQRWLEQGHATPIAPTPTTTPVSPAPGHPLSAYDRWVRHANNASFAAQGAYNDLVPGFLALHACVSGKTPSAADWQRFYDAVRQLARRPQAERRAALQALALAAPIDAGHDCPPQDGAAPAPRPIQP